MFPFSLVTDLLVRLVPLARRVVEVMKRHPFLPLKIAAVGLALAALPALSVITPTATPAVAGATIPAAIATAEEAREAATELAPETVATVTSATRRALREADRVIREGGVLMGPPQVSPALPPSKGVVNALEEAGTPPAK